jgi:hypothetical protein
MKRSWAIVPLLAGLAMACSETTVPVDDLIGTWNATEFVFANFEDPVTDFDVIAMGGEVEIVIRADNTYTITFTLPFSAPDATDGTWELDGDLLTFTDEGEVDGIELEIELSGTTLTVHSEDVTFDFDDGAGEIPAQFDATFVKD